MGIVVSFARPRHWWWRPFISAAGVDLLRPRTVSHGNLLHDCPWGSLISTVLRFDSPSPASPPSLIAFCSTGRTPSYHTTTTFSRFTTVARQDRSKASWGMDRVISALNYRGQDQTAMVIIGAGTIDSTVFFSAAVVAKVSMYLSYLTLDCHHWWVG